MTGPLRNDAESREARIRELETQLAAARSELKQIQGRKEPARDPFPNLNRLDVAIGYVVAFVCTVIGANVVVITGLQLLSGDYTLPATNDPTSLRFEGLIVATNLFILGSWLFLKCRRSLRIKER